MLLKLSRVEEKLGQYPEALRWVERAREALEGEQGLEAARQSRPGERVVRDGAAGAGHTRPRRCSGPSRRRARPRRSTIPRSLGNAYFVMGWAHGVLGKEGGEALMLKSLEAYRRSGNRVRQAIILSNLGATCYWEGRWDDAMSYYERGREESLKVGNLVHAAAARMNVAEILTDRGELAEAESMLQQTLPVWKSSEYRYFLGACHWMLGRVSLRGNRIDEALARFDEARKHADRRSAPSTRCSTSTPGSPSAGCSRATPTRRSPLADEMLGAPTDSAEAIARLTPQLHRVRGYAMLLQADPFGAREAFEASAGDRARAQRPRSSSR